MADTFKSKMSAGTDAGEATRVAAEPQNTKSKKQARSDSSSSEEITIKINLKKAGEKAKRKKHRTINVCTQEDSDDGGEPAKAVKPKLSIKQPAVADEASQREVASDFKKQPEVQKKEPTPPPIRPVEADPAPVPATESPQIETSEPPPKETEKAAPTPAPVTKAEDGGALAANTDLQPTTSEGTGQALSSLGLGIKVVQTNKTLTVKPKTVKTAKDLDPRLHEAAVTLTNKNASPEMKEAAVKKLAESSPGYEFVKIGLTDKGREEQLADLDSRLSAVRGSALKVYAIEGEIPAVVGGLHWDTMASLGNLDQSIFKFTVLSLANADDEKEVTKTLKNCLKAKQAE